MANVNIRVDDKLKHDTESILSAFRECHIKGDWLLIYRIIEDKLILSLHSTGTHSDLFG